MYDMILVRFGEMTLKKKNYYQFLRKMVENIKNKCRDLDSLTYSHSNHRFYIYLNGTDYQIVIDRLNTVVGLYSYSLCKKVDSDIRSIAKGAIEVINSVKPNKEFTFKVETNRGNKNYPLNSIEISQQVAKLVLPEIAGMSVDVRNPELRLQVDLRTEGTYIYTNSIKGLGGYPSGIAGSGLLMMSGGIDSPVAGFLTIKKGVNLKAIHFASPPHTSDMSLQKVIELVEGLSVYMLDGKIDLYVVPFTNIQTKIHMNANRDYIITLMRRAMYKIADKFARENKIDCIINGESIGQVASQTLESIRVVNDVTNYPIMRPLITYDKEEIIELSKKINTFDISIRPYEDCCTVFVPEHPIIKPNLKLVIREEAKCDLDEDIDIAISEIKKYKLSYLNPTSIFNDDKFTI
ncbi:MAG: tRNA uracil 4-sulfurtransferase ThiI [Bacilli bacterium]